MSVEKNIIAPDRKYWDRMFATPGVLAIITTVDADGRINAGAFATCVRTVHNPVQISFTTFTTGTQTYDNVKATGQFVVNLPSFDKELLEKVCCVGLPFPPGVNELEKAGLTAIPSIKVKPPRVSECPRHFECEVIWTKEWLDRVTIQANVVSASIHSDCMDDDGFVLWDSIRPVMYCGAPYLNQPPHKHLFVAGHETMAVDMPLGGVELEKYNAMIKRLDI